MRLEPGDMPSQLGGCLLDRLGLEKTSIKSQERGEAINQSFSTPLAMSGLRHCLKREKDFAAVQPRSIGSFHRSNPAS